MIRYKDYTIEKYFSGYELTKYKKVNEINPFTGEISKKAGQDAIQWQKWPSTLLRCFEIIHQDCVDFGDSKDIKSIEDAIESIRTLNLELKAFFEILASKEEF